MRWAFPIPTRRFVALWALGLAPFLLSAAFPHVARVTAWADLALLVLLGVDGALAPSPRRIGVQRLVEPVLSAGIPQPVTLRLTPRSSMRLRGEVRDVAPLDMQVDFPRQPFAIEREHLEIDVRYHVTSPRRGDFPFGDVYLRIYGPLGLCSRQGRVALAQTVRVFPNLTVLSQDALALARASEAWAKRPLRRLGQGTEFESLRLWSAGDDRRHVDWKASARRGQPVVRVHQPEKNQQVFLLLDCGRHMAGLMEGRRKLDHAVDAALRVARVSLDTGDAVGLLAFGQEPLAQLAPRRGAGQLSGLTRALYRIEAQLTESDYGRALDGLFRQRSRRTLVVVFTDLLDRDASATLVKRTLALLPRHLPVIVSLLDPDLEAIAHQPPVEIQDAYSRHVAGTLDDEYRLNASRLRSQGARVVRARAASLGAAAVSEYLQLKGQGRL
jgi:uncharacterized protein (DUF58 family)